MLLSQDCLNESFIISIFDDIRPFTIPVGLQHLRILLAIVDGFKHGFDRQGIVMGDLFRSACVLAESLSIEDFRPNATIFDEPLPIT